MLSVLDLRNRGVKAIEEEISKNGIATLSYRGKPKYVILDIEDYDKLREIELIMAYEKAKEDIKKGSAEIVTNEEELNNHLKELKECIN